jgi:hypothetical protein
MEGTCDGRLASLALSLSLSFHSSDKGCFLRLYLPLCPLSTERARSNPYQARPNIHTYLHTSQSITSLPPFRLLRLRLCGEPFRIAERRKLRAVLDEFRLLMSPTVTMHSIPRCHAIAIGCGSQKELSAYAMLVQQLFSLLRVKWREEG